MGRLINRTQHAFDLRAAERRVKGGMKYKNLPIRFCYALDLQDERARVKELEGALHKYGEHLDDCRILSEDPQPCSCGLLNALDLQAEREHSTEPRILQYEGAIRPHEETHP